MSGPAPLPKTIHMLHGNPSKKNFKEPEPEPDVKIPKIPKHLGKVARQQWRYIAPKLEELGIISETDQTALAAYCEAYEHWVHLSNELAADVKQTAIFKKTKLEEDAPMPFKERLSLNRVIIQVRDQLRKLVAEFGMTPSSRGKVVVRDMNSKNKNPYDAWKKGK